MLTLGEARVCIVGLGLMGGSLGLALRQQRACRTVIGADSNPQTCAAALTLGAIDSTAGAPDEAAAHADVVVLATPVRAIIALVERLAPVLQPDALLMDLGSTKLGVVQAMARLPEHVQAIGGHPMCGKEQAGIAAAAAGLWRGAVFCLTPLPEGRTSPAALALAQQMALAVGARPLLLDAARHDRLVASSSHLPYLLSASLMLAAAEAAAPDPLLWQVAASGFRSTGRLAGSDAAMMLDVLLTNRVQVSGAARVAAGHLLRLAALVEAEDERALRPEIAHIQEIWQEAQA